MVLTGILLGNDGFPATQTKGMENMGRQAKGPWFREADGFYYTTINGKPEKLCKDRKEAWNLFREAHARKDEAGAQDEAAAICNAYLEGTKDNKAKETYKRDRIFLSSFCRECGGVKVRDLKKHHLTKWLAGHTDHWNSTTRADAGATVKTAFKWAEEEGLITRNPFFAFKKTGCKKRDTIVSREEWERISKPARGDFRAFLDCLWECGSRPKELRVSTVEHVDLEAGCICLPPEEHKTGKRTQSPRFIWFTPAMRTVIERQVKKYGTGHLFRSRFDKPLSKTTVQRRFRRLCELAGVAANVTLYTSRHSFATDALQKLDVATVATLMGHSSTKTLMRNYSHLVKVAPYMQDAAEKARQPKSK